VSMSDPADTTYRSRLDELLRRYGRKAQTPERDAGTPSLSYSEISARPEKKGSWKKQTTAHKAPKTAGPASRPSSAVNNTSPFLEAARTQAKKRPVTAGIAERGQLAKSMSHVTPDIERYYEYHKELYDFTYGAERETARSSLETGWKQTNVPCAYQIPSYDARLDPHCPAAWRAGNPRPSTSPKARKLPVRSALKPNLVKGVSYSSPKTLRRSPDKSQSERAVYANLDLLSHPTIRDFKSMPLELPRPNELISASGKPGKRKLRAAKRPSGVSLLESQDCDLGNPQQLARLQDKIESLWVELCLPQYECEHYAATFLDEPTVPKLQQANDHLKTLQRHRSRTLEVLRHIQLRESVLSELATLVTSESMADMAMLIKLVPALRLHTVAAVEAVDAWRQGLWRPMPFMWNGLNYLLKASTDLLPFFNLPWALKVPSSAALDAVRRRHPGRNVILFLNADRPHKLVPAAELEQLRAVEASVLQEEQLQSQCESHASQLLTKGFMAPTLRPGSPETSLDDQLSPTVAQLHTSPVRPVILEQPVPQHHSPARSPAALVSPKFTPVCLDIASAKAARASPAAFRSPGSSPAAAAASTAFRSPTGGPARLQLDLGLVGAAVARDVIAQVDGKLLRPKFKSYSPSTLEGASLALNLSSVMEDRAMLLGSSKPPQPPTPEDEEVSSTDDVDNTDIDSDYVDNTDIDEEVANIMASQPYTSFKPIPGSTSPENVPGLNFEQLAAQMTDSSGGSYSEQDMTGSYYGQESSDQYYGQESSDHYSDSFYNPPQFASHPGGSRTP